MNENLIDVQFSTQKPSRFTFFNLHHAGFLQHQISLSERISGRLPEYPRGVTFHPRYSVIKASGQRRRWCGQMKIEWSLAAWRQEGKGCKDLIDHLRVTLVSSLSSRLLARRFTVTPNLSYLRILQTLDP